MVNHQPHRLAGRYEVRSMIGRGGMAQVHLGFDMRLSRNVAIKMLRTDLARDSIFQTRFRREAQAAASLNHPNIVAVYDTGEEEVTAPDGSSVSVPYIVMEYVEGHTVRDLLAGGTPVPIDEAVEIISGVLAALEYSHTQGLVHRDIKPGNIMLTNTGKIKVMDFGIARALTDSQATMTQTNAVVGTAQYLSPEQARGEVVDARSDIYSTGCVLFELLTGQPPFKGDTAVAVAYQHVSEIPPVPSAITNDVPDSIDRVVLKALAKEKDQRYTSAQAMLSDLERAARGALVLAPAADSWEAPPTQQQDYATRTMPLAPPPAPEHHTQVHRPLALTDAEEPEEEKRSRTGLIIALTVLVLALLAAAGFAIYKINNPEEPPVEQVAVPTSIIGETQDRAREILEEAGLEFEIAPERQADKTIAEGSVVSSDPAPGKMVDKGSVVTVTLSSGPESITIPDVSGLSQENARRMLEEAGLTVGDVRSEDNPSQDKDHVIRTDPEVGTELKEGDTVALIIASGNVVVSKDLEGQDLASVKQKLQELKLNWSVQEEESSRYAPGVVMRLSTTGTVEVGSHIEIIVAKEPAPEPVPEPEPEPTEPSTNPSENSDNN
ncbi:MAG: Stk1 family PASTA domain-containing Ser/Thr kinase [Actinomycetaceae bacterium]|nr:Stk1 family PASTA domain-containing Ser/Thr kinase [Actinomycetaceae bacterium]